ncbi:unnamed protein product [Closterium sp. NIES-53]
MATITVVAAARGGQQQPLPHPDMLSPQQLRKWETFSPQLLSELVSQRCVTGIVEAATLGANEYVAALGAGESAAAPGASESASALGASEFSAAPGAFESAAALGARASTATGPASAEALHAFTLDSGTSCCFFRDCTTLTPLSAPVPVSLADPTGGPVVARASTVLPCPAVPSGSLSCLHLPTFSTSLVSNTAIQDVWVDTFNPRGQRVAICQVAASSQVSASGQLAASCSYLVLSHQTLLWHHRLDHPSMSCLRSMHFPLLVSGLPRSLPSLPRLTALPCLPCIEGRQRAAPHSSEFPPTTAPLQTLHMDMWGPAPVNGTDQERCFLLTFTLPASPQQNGIAEHRIGMIMEVAHTSMIHAAAPHFLWPSAVRYATHQLNLWPRVSEPKTSPTLRWMGKVGDASVFRVWGALLLVRDAKASKLSSCTLCCIFLGFPTDAPPWQLYHPRERRVFSSHDVTFDESFCFYRLYPHASHLIPLAPLFLLPVAPPIDPLPPQGPAPSCVSQVNPPPLVEPLEISSDSSDPAEGGDPAADDTTATRRTPRLETPSGFPPWPSSPPPQPAAMDSGAETASAEPGGAETEGEGSRGAATGGAGSGGAATGGADSWGAASPSGGGAVDDPAEGPGAGQPPQPDLLETLFPQAIRAWNVRRGSPGGGGYGPAGAGAASPGGAGGTRGAAGAGGTGAASPGGTGGAAGAGGAGATSPGGATGAGGAGPSSSGGTASAGAARVGGAAGAGGAGGTGAAAGTGGAGATGAGAAGAAGPGGARTGGTGAAGAASAARAGGGTGAAGTGGASAAGAGGAGPRGTVGAGAAGPWGARTRGAGAAGPGGAAGAGGAGGATRAAGTGGAGGTASAGGAGAGGTGGTGGAGAAGHGDACTRSAGAAGAGGATGAGGAAGAGGAGSATGAASAGGAGAAAPRRLFF